MGGETYSGKNCVEKWDFLTVLLSGKWRLLSYPDQSGASVTLGSLKAYASYLLLYLYGPVELKY